jgi:enhancing lycopene biosynthesis protein 2
MAIRVGVVLGGCGVFDGSEIHEAVSILIALDRRGASIQCMAPDVEQTIDHVTKKPASPARNVLRESARIARGKIIPIEQAKPDELDALVFPGGYGAVKNLCTFAMDGVQCKVNPHVERLVSQMHAAKKPIGAACIAPVLLAKVLGGKGAQPKLTIGTDAKTASALEEMGARHVETGPVEICQDEENRLVTTPCYMNDVGPWTVFQGAERMVEEVLKMAGDPASLIRGQLGSLK